MDVGPPLRLTGPLVLDRPTLACPRIVAPCASCHKGQREVDTWPHHVDTRQRRSVHTPFTRREAAALLPPADRQERCHRGSLPLDKLR